MAPGNNRPRAMKLSKSIKDYIMLYKSEIQELDASHNSRAGLYLFLYERNPRITYSDVARWMKKHRWITTAQIEIVNVPGSLHGPNERVIQQDQVRVEIPHFPPPNQHHVIHDYRVLEQDLADGQQNFQNPPPEAMNLVIRNDNFNYNQNNVQFQEDLLAATPPPESPFHPNPPPESPFHPNPPPTFQQNIDHPSTAQHRQSIFPHYDHHDPLFSVFNDSGVSDHTDGSPTTDSEIPSLDQQALLKNVFLRMKRVQDYTHRFHRQRSLKKLQRKAAHSLALTYGFVPGESEHSAALRCIKQEHFQDP